MRLAARPAVVRRGLKVGLIVGSVLTVINYGDALIEGSFMAADWWRVGLTYMVPYCVSTYVGVDAIRGQV